MEHIEFIVGTSLSARDRQHNGNSRHGVGGEDPMLYSG
jgi:hypothetical protein